MLDIFNKNKLPEHLKDILAPNSEFIGWTKNVFLTEFRRKFAVPRKNYFLAFGFRFLTAVGALFILTSGLAVYADQKNAGPDNLFYPLKRYSEFFQLALAKQNDLPKLHIKLAKRRVEEMRLLGGGPNPAPGTIARKIRRDLRGNLEAALIATDSKNYPAEQISSFCKSFSDFAGEEAVEVSAIMIRHPDIAAKFRDKCAGFLLE